MSFADKLKREDKDDVEIFHHILSCMIMKREIASNAAEESKSFFFFFYKKKDKLKKEKRNTHLYNTFRNQAI